MTAGALLERLRAYYVKPGDAMPGGMFMSEVALGNRRIDGLYCGFFASRGKYLIGFEIKVARSDWLAELENPAKAEVWEQNVHQWYIVAPDTEIVRPEELPDGWGLMIPDPNPRTKTRMLTVVKATRHTDRNPSWAATHAIIQKADTTRMEAAAGQRSIIWNEVSAAFDKRLEEELARRTNTEHLTSTIADQKKLIDGMRDILGVEVSENFTWRRETVSLDDLRSSFGRYLRADMDANAAIKNRHGALERAHEAIGEAIAAMRAAGVEEAR